MNFKIRSLQPHQACATCGPQKILMLPAVRKFEVFQIAILIFKTLSFINQSLIFNLKVCAQGPKESPTFDLNSPRAKRVTQPLVR